MREQTAYPSRARAPSERLDWADAARGLGIILVVYGHANRAVFKMDTAPSWAKFQDTFIYSFHMATFFLLTGLFVWKSLEKNRAGFVPNKIKTIVYPYFLWSIIEGGLQLPLGKYINNAMSINDLLGIPFRPIDQYWFLYALFLCQMLVFVIYPRKWLAIPVTIILYFSFMITRRANIIFRTFAFLPFVVMGMFSGPIFKRIADASFSVRVMVLCGAWALFAAIFTPAVLLGYERADLVLLLLGSTGACGTVALATLFTGTACGRLLTSLGEGSMAIFVMHTIFAAGARIVIRKLGVPVDGLPLVLLTTLAGIALPYAAWRVSERWGWSAILGIGAGRPKVQRASIPAG